MHARVVVGGWEKVSFLERCPQFRGVLIERFHCIPTHRKQHISSGKLNKFMGRMYISRTG